jgi:glyoxylase-like metal-dependent hydrolase (beta-lactamase superfamily II)
VITLLDRHRRDSAQVAARLGVPHHDVPFDGVPGAPFELLPVRGGRLWREVALWWPDARVLACGDALGTTAYYRAGDERLAVHPVLRIRPPKALAALEPLHVLCGHGEGVHGDDATPALREALATARRRLPRAWSGAITRR